MVPDLSLANKKTPPPYNHAIKLFQFRNQNRQSFIVCF
ncbi:hypothetical protein LEP1GSC203_2207 [Leptospira terpstrae serovar Hualin str. LT 11-33 = ATCC 700639]|uniref:Uncharacterized protein n=1 Tax=Leptospira terpstrae serovar Hualin str. LT 11-33 = ATCC 700639 TaxID=1257025 RepID=N1VV89_9LEPT|nr:hypothetical protein LEP1GSC203_2207 [Leptospira terpstrae serovar Hualin str. LT 11-33 = ATCC 700639]